MPDDALEDAMRNAADVVEALTPMVLADALTEAREWLDEATPPGVRRRIDAALQAYDGLAMYRKAAG